MACTCTLRLPLLSKYPRFPRINPNWFAAPGGAEGPTEKEEINPQTALALQKPLPGKASSTPCDDTRQIPAQPPRQWLQAMALTSYRRRQVF